MSAASMPDDAVRALYAGNPLIAEVVTALFVLGAMSRPQAAALLDAAPNTVLTDRERRAVLLRFGDLDGEVSR